MSKSTSQWPAGANTGPSKPIYTCTCGAQSSSPITHTHGGAR